MQDFRRVRRMQKGQSPKVDQAHILLGMSENICMTVAHAESY